MYRFAFTNKRRARSEPGGFRPSSRRTERQFCSRLKVQAVRQDVRYRTNVLACNELQRAGPAAVLRNLCQIGGRAAVGRRFAGRGLPDWHGCKSIIWSSSHCPRAYNCGAYGNGHGGDFCRGPAAGPRSIGGRDSVAGVGRKFGTTSRLCRRGRQPDCRPWRDARRSLGVFARARRRRRSPDLVPGRSWS